MAKNLPANAGDARDGSLIPESGGRNSSPLKYSCLENFIEESGGLKSVGVQKVKHD